MDVGTTHERPYGFGPPLSPTERFDELVHVAARIVGLAGNAKVAGTDWAIGIEARRAKQMVTQCCKKAEIHVPFARGPSMMEAADGCYGPQVAQRSDDHVRVRTLEEKLDRHGKGEQSSNFQWAPRKSSGLVPVRPTAIVRHHRYSKSVFDIAHLRADMSKRLGEVLLSGANRDAEFVCDFRVR